MVDEVTGQPRQIPFWMLTLAGLGVFAGCVGKSAQFPLHVWLPDAMAGPTPVSALIHAATMVAAGVYLVGRFFPLFTADVLLYIAYTGGITLFIAASIAMVQTDYKKVLAYSTVSQLGFMMLGLGVGGWAAGLFHLLTHAFFKALLFLGAGSVYHASTPTRCPSWAACGKKMPITAYTMLVGTLAISGVPFFSGFYSKDAILAAAMAPGPRRAPSTSCSSCCRRSARSSTAFYMFRMWFLCSTASRAVSATAAAVHSHVHDEEHAHGTGHARPRPRARPRRNPDDHAHESGPLMTWPLLILAVPRSSSAGPGARACRFGRAGARADAGLRRADRGDRCRHAAHWRAMGASLVIATPGIGLGILYYAARGHPVLRADTAATPTRDGRAVRRVCTTSWSTSGTSTSSTTRSWCARRLALARLCRQLRPVVDRRHRQRLGRRDRRS